MWITFEPLERSAGFEFVDKTVGGSVPKEFVPAVEKGLKIQKEAGVLAKYPTRRLPRDSDGRQLPRRRFQRADVRDRRQGGVSRGNSQSRAHTSGAGDESGDRDSGRLSRRRRFIGDINRRRGMIQDQLERGTNIAVVATVPLASEMFGYIGQLRGMTSGRASYTMEFSHYEPVPRNVADEVIAEAAKPAVATG